MSRGKICCEINIVVYSYIKQRLCLNHISVKNNLFFLIMGEKMVSGKWLMVSSGLNMGGNK